MFEKLIRELNSLQGQSQIAVPISADHEGYLDRECPAVNCLYQFKVLATDWPEKLKHDHAFCPMCGHEAHKKSWFTSEQIKNARQQAIQHIKGRIGEALRTDARDFNWTMPRGGFITMTATVTNSSPRHFIMPVTAKEKMEQKLSCPFCSCNYAVIGSAFFCPACGRNSAEETFDKTVQVIEETLNSISTVKEILSSKSKDQAENTCRSLIENSLIDCVVAFQRFCDATYSKHTTEKIPMNAFQRLDTGEQLWKKLLGESYGDWLTKSEQQQLHIFFQRRHLLQHTQGIVDQKYVDKASDPTYKSGQRIVVSVLDVKKLRELIIKMVDAIRQKIERKEDPDI